MEQKCNDEEPNLRKSTRKSLPSRGKSNCGLLRHNNLDVLQGQQEKRGVELHEEETGRKGRCTGRWGPD